MHTASAVPFRQTAPNPIASGRRIIRDLSFPSCAALRQPTALPGKMVSDTEQKSTSALILSEKQSISRKSSHHMVAAFSAYRNKQASKGGSRQCAGGVLLTSSISLAPSQVTGLDHSAAHRLPCRPAALGSSWVPVTPVAQGELHNAQEKAAWAVFAEKRSLLPPAGSGLPFNTNH